MSSLDGEAATLRAEGDRLFSEGAFPAAEALFATLIAGGHATSWNLFQYARCAVRQRDWPRALARLDTAMSAAAAVPWAALEKAQVLERSGAPVAEVASAAAWFSRHAPPRLNEAHYAMLAKWAHAAFDARCHDQAAALYDFLVAREHGGALCRLRQADLRVNHGAASTALDLLRDAAFPADLAPWAEAVKARALIALRRDQEARATLLPLVQAMPGNIAFIRMLFGVLERLDDRAALARAAEFVAGLAPGERIEFLLRAALWREDAASLSAVCEAVPPHARTPLAPLIAAAMNRAIGRGDFAAVEWLFEGTAPIASDAPPTISALLSACFARRDWTRAETVMATAAPLLQRTSDAELRLRHLELLCYTMRLDQAADLAAAWSAESPLPAIASGTVASLHAARGSWRKVIDLLLDRVARGMAIDAQPLLDAARTAARRAGDYATVIAALDQALARAPARSVARARQQLLAECALRRTMEGPHAVPAAEAILLQSGPGRALVAQAARLVSRAVPADTPFHIYFCADHAYLIGAATALHAALRNNPALRAAASLSVVCADADHAFAAAVFDAIGAAFSTRIDTIPASALGAAGNLRVEWGLFTPGHALAESAYWRIFMARHLVRQGAGGRALYLDADVIVGPGIARLLRAGLGGRALSARIEEPLAEVAEASARLGVPPATYFNSGVLLMDLDHPATAGCLDTAIAAARHRQDILTFHDQCALNLGFSDQLHPMPENHHRFQRAGARQVSRRGTPIVTHYMARPKPWEMFGRGARPRAWQDEFRLLTELLRPEQIRTLLSAAFAPAPVAPAMDEAA